MPTASGKGKATAAAVAAFSIFHDGIGTSSLPPFNPQDTPASVTPSTNTNLGRSLTRALTFSPPSRASPQPSNDVFDIFSSFTGGIPCASKGKTVAAPPLPNNEKENCDLITGEPRAGTIPDKKSKAKRALALSGSNHKASSSKPPGLKRSNTSPAIRFPAADAPSFSTNVFGTLGGNGRSESLSHNSNATTSASGSGSRPRPSKPEHAPTALGTVAEECKKESLEATVTGRIILARMIFAESEADRRARELTEVVLGDLSQAYDASETAHFTCAEKPATILDAAELTARLDALLHCPSGQELPMVVRQRALPCGVKRAYDESDNESDDATDYSQAFTSVVPSQAFSPAPEARKVKKLKTAKFGVNMSPAVTKLGAIEEVEPLPPIPPVPHTTPAKDKDTGTQAVETVNTSPVSLRRLRTLSGSRQEQVDVTGGPVASSTTSRAFGLPPPPPPFLLAAHTDTGACDEGDVFGCL